MILGVDPGTKRVGLALADPETCFARPLETVDASVAIERIASLVRTESVTTVVVGRPLSLSGAAGAAAHASEAFARSLRDELPDVSIVEFDERLTTVVAQRRMRDAGLSSKRSRAAIDSAAAQVMLQDYLDMTGT